VTKLAAEGIPVAALETCMHHPDGGPGGDPSLFGACDCRKPKDGMLLRGSRDFEIALARSIVVGDSDRDVLAGSSAGCRTVFVRNEYNAAEAARCSPGFVVNSLSEIVPLL